MYQLITPPNKERLKAARAVGGHWAGRESNFEALRIVAMSMILLGHFLVHGITMEVFQAQGLAFVYHMLSGFLIYGVDIFFLISGYFGIKFSGRGCVKFVLTVFVFNMMNLVLKYLFAHEWSLAQVAKSIIFPVSGSPYWFMKQYLLLMITAPILNAGLRLLSQDRVRQSVALLALLLCYMLGSYATYSYLNGFLFYCIGFCLSQGYWRASVVRNRYLVVIYVVASLLAALLSMVFANAENYTIEFCDYENLFALVGCLSVFLLFARMKFRSRMVNVLASAALGCYLLQDGYFGYGFLYEWQIAFVEKHGFGFETVLMFLGCFVAFWCASLVITRINALWLGRASSAIALRLKSTLLERCRAS